MCELATQSSEWIAVDSWEAASPEYLTTLPVLEHFNRCLNTDTGNDPIQVKLLCGGDLLESMNTPGVWHPEDVNTFTASSADRVADS